MLIFYITGISHHDYLRKDTPRTDMLLDQSLRLLRLSAKRMSKKSYLIDNHWTYGLNIYQLDTQVMQVANCT